MGGKEVKMGHDLVKKRNEVLRGRCDSFVVETNVHYPADINLLFDAMRNVITLTGRLCDAHDDSSWRQHRYNVGHVKRAMRKAQMKKREGGKTEVQREKRQLEVVAANREYIAISAHYIAKAKDTLSTLGKQKNLLLCLEIKTKPLWPMRTVKLPRSIDG